MPSPLGHVVLRSTPLFLALGLLMAGNGLHASLLGLRAGPAGFGTAVIGAVMSAYYVGFLLSSVVTPRLIGSVGHIRAFSGLASLASGAVLIHVVFVEPATWAALRFLSGFCIAGLYVVTETWLNGAATNATRGQLLSLYMVVVTGGVGAGQLLLNAADPAGFAAFVLASVLVSLAVVPVSLVRVSAPEVEEAAPMPLAAIAKVAPLALVGSAASGATTGAIFAMGAVYAATVGLSVAQTSVLLAAVLIAAVVFQFPLGAASDRVDRRWVLAGAALVASAAAVAAAFWSDPGSFPVLVVAAAVAGGLGYPLYSLSNAHLNDYLDTASVVAAGAKLVLVNGAGAIAGPLVASAVMEMSGAAGFFWVLATVYSGTGLYALYRMTRRAAVAEGDRAEFAPLPAGVTPRAVSLVPDVEAELHPVATGVTEVDGTAVRWAESGAGPVAVVVPGGAGDLAGWTDELPVLADGGFRAVAYDVPPVDTVEGDGGHDAVVLLEAVLSDRDVAACHLVVDGDPTTAIRFATTHPERAESIVLVAPGPSAIDAVTRSEAEIRCPVIHVTGEELVDQRADAVVAVLRSLPDRRHA